MGESSGGWRPSAVLDESRCRVDLSEKGTDAFTVLFE
jgi:hypothetical protein